MSDSNVCVQALSFLINLVSINVKSNLTISAGQSQQETINLLILKSKMMSNIFFKDFMDSDFFKEKFRFYILIDAFLLLKVACT